MKLTKPSPSLITEFKAVQAQLRGALPRKMFGYDAAFVNGNMAVGLWQNTCVVKVSERDQAELLGQGLAIPFAPMKGRVMSGWVELSEELAHDPEQLLHWSQRAVKHVSSLPPKAARPTRPTTKLTPTPTTRKKVSEKKAPENERRRGRKA